MPPEKTAATGAMLERMNIPLKSSKAALIIITAMSTVFVLKNALDEGYLLGTWSAVLMISAFWLVVPYLTLLIGLLAKSGRRFWGSMVYALLLMALFAMYAMNGSTADRGEGAQHMHLVLVPIFLLFVSFVLICALSVLGLLRRLTPGRSSRNIKQGETT